MTDSRSVAEVLADIRQEKDIQAEVHKFAQVLGYSTYTLGYINPVVSERAFFVHNHPVVDFDMPDVASRDPVLARLQAEPSPFSWGREVYVQTQCDDIWEAGSQAGISAGLIAPIRPGNGRRMMISLDKDQALDGTAEHIGNQLARLDHFTRLMAGTAVSLFDTYLALDAALSDLEKEVLRWTFAGLPPYAMTLRLRPHRGFDCIQKALSSAAAKLGTDDPVVASMLAARAGVLGAV